MQRGVKRAFLCAPLAALLAYWLVAVGHALARDGFHLLLERSGHVLFFMLLFGGPIVYLATLLFGVPFYCLLRRLRLLRLAPVLLASGVIGGAVLAWFTQSFWGTQSWNRWDMAVGAACGMVGGVVFWWFVPRPTAGAPAA